ncbi:ankyrin repeat-containing domain protein [Geopyxis carbonaria]|nr:ankyrin repeat-containing domain protein [Geopyxis carbonaria]
MTCVDTHISNATLLTPLHLVAPFREVEIINLLLEYDANVNKRRYDGLTALNIAVHHRRKDSVLALLKARSDPNSLSKKGISPLIIAARYNHLEILKILIDKGAKRSHTNKEGRSALSEAVRLMCPDIVLEMIRDSRGQEYDQATQSLIFLLAVVAANEKVVEILLEYKFDKEHCDIFGRKPWNVAHRPKIREMLQPEFDSEITCSTLTRHENNSLQVWWCDPCKESLSGLFYHCCTCSPACGDDTMETKKTFDMCLECAKKGCVLKHPPKTWKERFVHDGSTLAFGELCPNIRELKVV